MADDSNTYLIELRNLLIKSFSIAELKDLCLYLHVDFETIPGEEKTTKSQELILYLMRQNRLQELDVLLRELRPNVFWPSIPDKVEPPVAWTPGDIPYQKEVFEKELLDGILDEVKKLKVGGDIFLLEDVFTTLYVESLERDSPISTTEDYLALEHDPQKERKKASGTTHFWLKGDGIEKPIASESLLMMMQKNFQIVLTGEPGAGKSTALQFLAWQFCLDKKSSHVIEDRIPILLPLKDVAKNFENERIEFAIADLVGKMTRCNISQAEKIVDIWLNDGKLILLFDGLDEVPEKSRTEIIQDIRRFARSKKGENCKVVVTSRPASYCHFGERFKQYKILPISIPDSKTYIAQWITALPKLDRLELESHPTEIQNNITNLVTSNDALRTPLLLRLLSETFINTQEKVQSPAEIYDLFIERVAWERSRSLRDNSRPLKALVFKTIESIAWVMQFRRLEKEAEIIEAIRPEFDYSENISELINFIVEGMGLLKIDDKGLYKIVSFTPHSTFRDYFVAKHLDQLWRHDPHGTWRLLKPYIHSNEWMNSILFLSTMLQEESATLLIMKMWKSQSPFEEELHRDLLLVGKCLSQGVTIDSELRNAILYDLIILYVNSEMGRLKFFYRPPYGVSLSLNQEISDILNSLNVQDQTFVSEVLIRIAKGEEKRYSILSINVINLVEDYLGNFSFINYDIPRYTFLLYLVLFIANFFKALLLFPVVFPLIVLSRYFGDKERRSNIATKTLMIYTNPSQQTASFLEKALEDSTLRSSALEVLGKIGSANQFMVDKLLEIIGNDLYAYKPDYREKAIESLGLLCQRNPSLVGNLINIVADKNNSGRIRHRITVALCKAAEVVPEAMDFVVKGFPSTNVDEGEVSKAYDEAFSEGIDEGKSYIKTGSQDVIRFLLELIVHEEDLKIFFQAGRILFRLIGSNPQVECKVILSDGKVSYEVVDFTDDLFNVLIRKPYSEGYLSSSSFLFGILLSWGIKDSDIAVRLIEFIIKSDALVLARMIETSHDSNIEESINRLRNPDEQVQEYQRWLIDAQNVFEWHPLFNLQKKIEYAKWETCIDCYSKANQIIYSAIESNHWQSAGKTNPSLLAAFACFRVLGGLNRIAHRLSAQDLQNILAQISEDALSIIKNSRRDNKLAFRILSSILLNEEPEIAKLDNLLILTNTEKEYLKDSVKLFQYELIATVGTLVEMSVDFPEGQKTLLSSLDVSKLDEYSKSGLDQHDLFMVIKHIRNADRSTVAVLYDIYEIDSELVGNRVFDGLENPLPEAVDFLLEIYEKVDVWRQIDIIRALGTVNISTRRIEEFLLHKLKDKNRDVREQAAKSLGDLAMLSEETSESEIFHALIRASKSTVEATISLGKRVVNLVESDFDNKKQTPDSLYETLLQAAKSQQRALKHRSKIIYLGRYLSGYQVDEILDSLGNVVNSLTAIEVSNLTEEQNKSFNP